MDAVRDISPEELDARRGPSEWSARQVVHHLADTTRSNDENPLVARSS
jgi:uncharacterized damage-inducible protein DinB